MPTCRIGREFIVEDTGEGILLRPKSIDTNIVVRFLMQDDTPQFKQAAELFREAELFIPESVLLETEWVLRGLRMNSLLWMWLLDCENYWA